MASRKLWKPAKKPNAGKPERAVWKPKSSQRGSAAAPAPGRSKRVLADVSKLKPVMLDHGWRFEEYTKVHGKPGRGRRPLGARWTCEYQQADGQWGCKSFVWQHEPGPGQFHAWDCPYWHLEGKDYTPF